MNILLNATQKQGETESKSSTLCPQTPKKNKERPQRSRQFCYGEKFLWLGVPQQTACHIPMPLTSEENATHVIKHLS